MTEKLSFSDQCNEYVTRIEDDYFTWLLVQENLAEHKRNKCKCKSCMGEPGRIGRMIVDEMDRLKPPQSQDRRIIISQGRK